MPSLLWKTNLNRGPALVAAGRVVGERVDVAVSSGSRVILFVPENGEYNFFGDQDLKEDITGLVVVRPGPEGRDLIAASTARSVALLGVRDGSLVVLDQTEPETGLNLSDIAAGDLDGDGRDEILAAAPGLESFFVYRLEGTPAGDLSLELVGIRVAPGTPRFVETAAVPGRNRAAVVVFENRNMSGLAMYFLAEQGFEAGPVLEGLPFRATAAASGNFTERPGDQIALGAGSMVWLVGNGSRLEVLLVTDSLGTAVPALAAQGEDPGGLIAGTPEGYVFIFNRPVGRSPDLAISVGEPVTGLAWAQGRVAVGTTLGQVQVWSLTGGSEVVRYIVQPGDTLWKIAGKFGVPMERILALNDNIKSRDVIMPGQMIKIPSS